MITTFIITGAYGLRARACRARGWGDRLRWWRNDLRGMEALVDGGKVRIVALQLMHHLLNLGLKLHEINN
jgi:hypothetical protein